MWTRLPEALMGHMDVERAREKLDIRPLYNNNIFFAKDTTAARKLPDAAAWFDEESIMIQDEHAIWRFWITAHDLCV